MSSLHPHLPSDSHPTGPPVPAVRVQSVSRLFGSFVALRNISFELAAGASALLLGANGSGKSTLLRLLAGLARPSYGTVQIWGAPPESSTGRIAYMGHQTMLYDELTGPENLRYLVGLQRPSLSRSERVDRVGQALVEVGLDPANPRRLAEYSQGMRQRTSLARVLLAEPDLLLLDEPFSNLDAGSAETMVRRLESYLAGTGDAGIPRTLLLTTHQAHLASPLARTVLTLSGGQIVGGTEPSDTPKQREQSSQVAPA